MKCAVIFVFVATICTVSGQLHQQCPRAFGDYPDGNGCVTFLRCWRGQPYQMRCPGGMAFDPANSRCVNQQQVACVQNNQVAGPLIGGNAPGAPAAIGQLQQPSINQVQVAGFQPGSFPNGGLFGVPPVLQPNQNPGAGAGVGAGFAAGAAAGAGAGAGANAGAGVGLGGAGLNRGVGANAGAGAGLANGNQPIQNGNAALLPQPGLNPALQPAGNPALQPAGNPAILPAGNPGLLPPPPGFVFPAPAGNPGVLPLQPQNPGNPGVFPPQRAGAISRGGFLNYPVRRGRGQPVGGQGQGQIGGGVGVPGGNAGVLAGGQNGGQAGNNAAGGNGGAGAGNGAGAGAGQGQDQGQGQAGAVGLIPLIVANQRQSASINQDQSVGVAPRK